MAVEEMEKPVSLSGADLAVMVREFRGARGWSQETLSEITKLSLRTIQRVENGEPSNGDTRRALALAFELEDADTFNKPWDFPTPEVVAAEVERIKRETVTLDATVAVKGQELTRLFDDAAMHAFSSAVELEGADAEALASLSDYLGDYRDCADSMTHMDKLKCAWDVQAYIDSLAKGGFTVVYARRDTKLIGQNWADKTPWPVTLADLVAYPKGSEPKVMLVPKKIKL
jgi:transcriptional regulator with XRE-family HTH domain